MPDIVLAAAPAGAGGAAAKLGKTTMKAADDMADAAKLGKVADKLPPAPGDGPVTFRPRSDLPQPSTTSSSATSTAPTRARVDGALSDSGRVSTGGDLRADASAAAAEERARALAAGQPYEGQVGHVPDTTWTGQPEAYE